MRYCQPFPNVCGHGSVNLDVGLTKEHNLFPKSKGVQVCLQSYDKLLTASQSGADVATYRREKRAPLPTLLANKLRDERGRGTGGAPPALRPLEEVKAGVCGGGAWRRQIYRRGILCAKLSLAANTTNTTVETKLSAVMNMPQRMPLFSTSGKGSTAEKTTGQQSAQTVAAAAGATSGGVLSQEEVGGTSCGLPLHCHSFLCGLVGVGAPGSQADGRRGHGPCFLPAQRKLGSLGSHNC